MEFARRAPVAPSRLAVFPGTFNPPTVAHLGLAGAALSAADEVLLVLPRVFPHKSYAEGPSFEQRLELLLAAAAHQPRFSVAATDHGLFIDIARDARVHYHPPPDLWFVCGHDAARRIAGWNYGHPGAFHRMLEEFGLLVAPRAGRFLPPDELSHRILTLECPPDLDAVSSTEVRRRVQAGEPWRHLVPSAIAEAVASLYR
ncbi:MAG: hypothetical protein SFV54_14075 [Bryobacteraceae bacterium]|nr:hypothetical protein [Bryobacteraceae bacterium]